MHQGIAAQDGTITSCAGSRNSNVVSESGLALVGWTRPTSWARVAFRSPPPLEDFIAMRLQPDYRARADLESLAKDLHDGFLRRRGITENMQFHTHQETN